MVDPNLDPPSCGLPHPIARAELVSPVAPSCPLCERLIMIYVYREFVSGMVAFFYADGYRARGRGLVKLVTAARTNVIR